MSKYCSKCGNLLTDEAAFCTNCGSKIQVPTPSNIMYQQVVCVKPKVPGRGFGISSLVLGIIGGFYSFVLFIGFSSLLEMPLSYNMSTLSALLSGIIVYGVLPVLALIFSLVSKHKGYKNGISTAGLVLGILGTVFILLAIIITIFIAIS